MHKKNPKVGCEAVAWGRQSTKIVIILESKYGIYNMVDNIETDKCLLVFKL